MMLYMQINRQERVTIKAINVQEFCLNGNVGLTVGSQVYFAYPVMCQDKKKF